jgi:hypothetical protein
MILDPTKIKQEISGETLTFTYPLMFKGQESLAKIIVIGTYPNRNVKVLLENENGEAVESYEFKSNDEGNEVQKSWEKFEDFFNESDEGKKEKQDEVENLYTSFDAVGNAVLFLQNLKGEQKEVLKYKLTDYALIGDLPMTYQMDMSNNQQLPEPLRVNWLMANVSDSVENLDNPSYVNTYQVAILGIPPTQPPTPPEEESDEMQFFRLIRIMSNMAFLKQYSINKKTKEENYVGDEMLRILNNSEPYKVETPMGEGTLVPYPSLDSDNFKAYVVAIKGGGGGGGDSHTDEPENHTDKPDKPTDKPDKPTDKPDKPTDKPDKPTDKPDKPTDKPDKPTDDDNEQDDRDSLTPIKSYDVSNLTSSVAKYLDVEPNQIVRSMRNVDTFRDLLDIYNVKVNDIATALNLPTNNNEFFKEVERIIEQ